MTPDCAKNRSPMLYGTDIIFPSPTVLMAPLDKDGGSLIPLHYPKAVFQFTHNNSTPKNPTVPHRILRLPTLPSLRLPITLHSIPSLSTHYPRPLPFPSPPSRRHFLLINCSSFCLYTHTHTCSPPTTITISIHSFPYHHCSTH